MSLEFQKKILRILEYQQFERVGGTKTIKVDVRVLAATNSDLESDMTQGKFRADLYDRLAFETIWLPPLRDRKEDIERLSYHFMDRFAAEVAGIKPKKLTSDTLDYLNAYNWPGNVRELKSIIERMTYKIEGDTIFPYHLPQELLTAYTSAGDAQSFSNRVSEFEKQVLLEAYEQCEGDLEAIAGRLRVPLDSVQQLIHRYEIEDD